jgi:hypothetical protein
MRTLILRVALSSVIAGPACLQFAHADIYTWADASGSVNVSNLDPPKGARVISVTHTAPASASREDAAREAARRAETRALEQRVRQLEDEVELARRAPPPQVVYPPIPAPAPYWAEPAPVQPVQYAVVTAPPAYNQGCDPSWLGCGLGWWPGFYPSVVFVRAPSFRRFPAFSSGHHFAGRPPMHSPGRSSRG